MSRLVGIELGGTKVIAVLGEGMRILARERIPLDAPDSTFARLRQILDHWNDEAPLEALGIASFGPVGLNPDRPDYGRLLRTPKTGWEGADLIGSLGFAGPTLLHTDVTAAALAEGRLGGARGCRDFAYMTVGTGIGVGIVASGAPLTGALHPEVRSIATASRGWHRGRPLADGPDVGARRSATTTRCGRR